MSLTRIDYLLVKKNIIVVIKILNLAYCLNRPYIILYNKMIMLLALNADKLKFKTTSLILLNTVKLIPINTCYLRNFYKIITIATLIIYTKIRSLKLNIYAYGSVTKIVRNRVIFKFNYWFYQSLMPPLKLFLNFKRQNLICFNRNKLEIRSNFKKIHNFPFTKQKTIFNIFIDNLVKLRILRKNDCTTKFLKKEYIFINKIVLLISKKITELNNEFHLKRDEDLNMFKKALISYTFDRKISWDAINLEDSKNVKEDFFTMDIGYLSHVIEFFDSVL